MCLRLTGFIRVWLVFLANWLCTRRYGTFLNILDLLITLYLFGQTLLQILDAWPHRVFLPSKRLVTALLPLLGGWRGAARRSRVWHSLWKWTHQPQRTNTQQGVQTDRETTQALPRYHHRSAWTQIGLRNEWIWLCIQTACWPRSPKATVLAAALCSRCWRKG